MTFTPPTDTLQKFQFRKAAVPLTMIYSAKLFPPEETSNRSENSNTESRTADDTPVNEWDAVILSLSEKFPGSSNGILFCIYKLQQNNNLTIVDFRDEALLHGIKLGGRALHSAKVHLGLAQAKAPRARPERTPASSTQSYSPRSGTTRAQAKGQGARDTGVEETLIQVVQQIQDSATADSQKLRTAIREALQILQTAIDN